MDWLEKTHEMVETLMESQEKMWQTWTESAKAPSNTTWEKTVKTWENSFKNFIETQALWARMWLRGINTNTTVEGADELVTNLEDMTRSWVDAQQQIWNNWFQMLKSFDPEQFNANTQGEMDKAMKTWKDGLQKLMVSQREWATQFASMTEDAKTTKKKNK